MGSNSQTTDLKGPITRMDCLKNRYLGNVVDHKSNLCRLFVTKIKDEAARNFKHFLVFFERRFYVRVHVLRTYGAGVYRTLDTLCQKMGVARHVMALIMW
ncbi:hypothetical protein PHPALM_28280 [Phytophthora palmivora]|uniref:Uncharacterized protein n=1 Tax=Phytophthora palmivora TaxID=4796 RepID=A0A2P4XAI4_9STRA|nr:hypothetical protein PHPALM_28280 [Phytophthora palmivora]